MVPYNVSAEQVLNLNSHRELVAHFPSKILHGLSQLSDSTIVIINSLTPLRNQRQTSRRGK